MTEAKRYHLTETGLVEGESLGRLSVVLSSDFDTLQSRLDDTERQRRAEFDAGQAAERLVAELQQRLTAADERVDLLEGLLSAATPSKRCECFECGSTKLTWYTQIKTNSMVAEGRLRTNEMHCVFFLGCDDCSETLTSVSADKIASLLLIPKP